MVWGRLSGSNILQSYRPHRCWGSRFGSVYSQFFERDNMIITRSMKTLSLSIALSMLVTVPCLAQGKIAAVKPPPVCTVCCLVVDSQGMTKNVTASSTITDYAKACEDAKKQITDKYPNATNCVSSPPKYSYPCPTVIQNSAVYPWKVSYSCMASNGQIYEAIGQGCTFCEAYEEAKAQTCAWINSLHLTCCSAHYTIDLKPCVCKPRFQLFRRR